MQEHDLIAVTKASIDRQPDLVDPEHNANFLIKAGFDSAAADVGLVQAGATLTMESSEKHSSRWFMEGFFNPLYKMRNNRST